MKNKINLKTSFIIDVVSFLDIISNGIDRSLLSDALKKSFDNIKDDIKINIPMLPINSDLLTKLLTFYFDTNELENCNLAKLIDVFNNVNNLVDVCNKNASNDFENRKMINIATNFLKIGFNEPIVSSLKALQDIDFENYYNNNLKLLLIDKIKQYENIDLTDTSKLLSQILGKEDIDCINVFFTLFTETKKENNKIYYTNFYYENVDNNYFTKLLIFQNLNNFLSQKIIKKYLEYVKSDEEYKKEYNLMIENKNYINKEDELNFAIQFYVLYKLCNYNYDNILSILGDLFDSKKSVAILIFKKLVNEGLDTTYESFLDNFFTSI